MSDQAHATWTATTATSKSIIDLVRSISFSLSVFGLVLLDAPDVAYYVIGGACGAATLGQLRKLPQP